MAITKKDNLFFRNHKNAINDQRSTDSQSLIRPIPSIALFAQMTRDENLNVDEVCDVLDKMDDFLDKKEFEKAETTAELQLAYALHDLLEERRAELIESAAYIK